MVLWKYTYREVRSRPGRAMLTLLSIVISVAAVVAVTVGKATTEKACEAMYENVAGRAALEVANETNGFFDKADVLSRVAQVPGVKAAVPSIQKDHAIYVHNAQVDAHHTLLAKGVDPDPKNSEAMRGYELVDGTWLARKDQNGKWVCGTCDVLLEAGLARGLGINVGDKIRMPTPKGGVAVRELTVVGLVSPKGTANFDQGGVIFLPITSAEFFFDKVGRVNRVSLVLDDNANEKAVAAAIAPLLPEGLTVRPPMARAQLSKDTIKSVEVGLTFACVTMIGVAIIMIVNTFMMNIGERRRQLAVLRAIGTTRRQLMRALLLEGIAMGLVGTLFGSLLGLGGAYLLTMAMGQVYSTAMPTLQITIGPFILALILGPSISLLAMFVPAYLAGKISPLEGMRFVVRENEGRITLRYVASTLTLFIVTGLLLGACVVGYLPLEGTIYAGVLFTLAFLTFVPIVLGPLARFSSFVLYPLLRVEGQIAQRQILRRRLRTSLTIGILYVVVSTIISIGTVILNNVEDIHSWQAKAFKGDYFIRTAAPSLGSGWAPPMSPALEQDFRAVPGVAGIDTVRMLSSKIVFPGAETEAKKVLVFIRDFTGDAELPLDIKGGGDVELIRQRLSEGQVVLGTVLANQLHLAAGDEITLDTAKGPKPLRVAGTTTVYLQGGMVVYMEGKTALQLFDLEGPNIFVIHAAPGAGEALHERLQTICNEKCLVLHSFADLRKRVDSLITGVVASLWGVLALGFVVGAFGIANTLTMNVLEQTRDLALLRVVAMTRWQVRRTILAQAVIIGFIGITLGSIGGVIGSYTSNFCSARLLGNPIPFTLQPNLLVVCFAIGMTIVLAAAWLPAERAARLNLLIALQYE